MGPALGEHTHTHTLLELTIHPWVQSPKVPVFQQQNKYNPQYISNCAQSSCPLMLFSVKRRFEVFQRTLPPVKSTLDPSIVCVFECALVSYSSVDWAQGLRADIKARSRPHGPDRYIQHYSSPSRFKTTQLAPKKCLNALIYYYRCF